MYERKYHRNIHELESHACKWWPSEVREEANQVSILQTLYDTQEHFISIMKLVRPGSADSVFNLIDAASFSYALFLKHLMVLTDMGSEPLQRVNKDFDSLFPNSKFVYDVGNGTVVYRFTKLPTKTSLTNKFMKIDSIENLTEDKADRSLCKDIITVLLFGAAATNPETKAVLYKCTPYKYLGDDDAVEDFVRKNYIRVSRIITGKDSNDLGNFAQQYVVKYLKNSLGENYNVKSNGSIPGITQNEGMTLTNFDVVVDRKNDKGKQKKYVAIEISFQETTNSVIERKAGQARDRFEKISDSHNAIAYIIDGAGNFARKTAVTTLCANSDCTVAYTAEEFNLLTEFIKGVIG